MTGKNIFYVVTDLETTGLNKMYKTATGYVSGAMLYDIMELSACVLDADFNVLGRVDSFISLPENFVGDPDTIKFHEDQGYLELYASKAKSTLTEVEAKLTELLEEVTGGELPDYEYGNNNQLVFTGFSVHFDTEFIKHKMPALYNKFMHANFDISPIKRLIYSSVEGLDKFDRSKTAHVASDDVDMAIEHAEHLRRFIRSHPMFDLVQTDEADPLTFVEYLNTYEGV